MDNVESEIKEEDGSRMSGNNSYGQETRDVIEQNLEKQINQTEPTNDNTTLPEKSKVINESSPTYIELVTERDSTGQPLSVLEVDLNFSREKGLENRALKMNFAGIDIGKKEMVEKSVNIDRENFEALKRFFCNLDWDS